MSLLTMFIFVLVIMVGGIAVDAMMAEMRRTQLQDTLDRAVLAAAALDQPLAPEVVVQDYLDNPRLAGTIKDLEVSEGLGFKSVRATAETTFKTKFMHWNWSDRMPTRTVDTVSTASGDEAAVPILDEEGNETGKSQLITDYTNADSLRYNSDAITQFTLNATSAAEESIGNVEISMVLDVSGSMRSNNRLTNLKVAAKDFVTTLNNTTEDGKLSISVVPYAAQVSASEELIQHFNVSSEHSYSNCVHFSASDFNQMELDPATPLTRAMHFDPWNNGDGRAYNPSRLVWSPVCPPATDSSREILVMQKDPTVLHSHIDNLWAGGNTSIDVGMKWGTALLDDSIQPVIDNMITDGQVHSDFVGRPQNNDGSDTLKVIVLMTDGHNTSQYYIQDDFRTGESNIWWNDEEKKYSVYIGEDTGDEDGDGDYAEPMFYWPHTGQWKDHAYGEGSYEETQTVDSDVCKSYRRNGTCKRYRKIHKTVTVNEPGSAEVLNYPDLWAYTSIKYNLYNHYHPWMNDSQANSDWYYSVRSSYGNSTKNARTKAICDAAKAEGVVVFTIGFEATSNGNNVLKDCASSINHFYDVDGLEISQAFESVASSIRQLRLTQ
ncbi:MAG: Tad domain-containing protein [Cognatishimia sp.]|uniref:pilus assembly protein TadG-related protein n=1 Tax=Cognatishimia sp. TaxID=2211648 RepID=UPI003B8D47A0